MIFVSVEISVIFGGDIYDFISVEIYVMFVLGRSEGARMG